MSRQGISSGSLSVWLAFAPLTVFANGTTPCPRPAPWQRSEAAARAIQSQRGSHVVFNYFTSVDARGVRCSASLLPTAPGTDFARNAGDTLKRDGDQTRCRLRRRGHQLKLFPGRATPVRCKR